MSEVHWEIQFASDNDYLVLTRLPSDTLDELGEYFTNITEAFDNLHSSSVFCTSVIYTITVHNHTIRNITLNYHIDSDEKVIRIASIDVN